jgi:hypothetical protein
MMDIQRFCSKNPMKHGLGKPFNQGGKTWATNGWVAIVVPEAEGFEDQTFPPMSSLMNAKAEVWHDLPDVEVEECKVCGGKVADYLCNECKGAGTVTLKNEYTKYSGIECGTCEGEGDAPICKHCSETGMSSTKQVKIGPAWFNANAIWFIRDLPGVQIAPTGETTVALLRFDGGAGFLMPSKHRNAH